MVEPHSLGKCLFLHLALGIANLAATVLGLAALEPVTRWLETAFVGVSIFAKYQMAGNSEVAGIVLAANFADALSGRIGSQ